MKVTLHVFGGPRTITVVPDQIVIEEAEGMHDLATLTFGRDVGRNLVAQLDLGDVGANDIGPPAMVEIIANNVLVVFYGYVDTTVETLSRTSEPSIEIYFLSASSIMRNGHPRVWRDKMPFQIASDILDSYGLGLEMDRVPYRIASFTQSKESDWETLRNLALRSGLSLTVAGPIIHIKDVINETRRAKGTSLTPHFRRPGSQVTRGLECTQFTQVASRTPVGGERYRYYGIDQLGSSFEVSGGVSVIERSPGVVVRSLATALREARRHESIGRFVTRASLEGPGLVGCSAGTCIMIDEDRFPEYWYISASKHTLTPKRDEYRMELQLCRQEGVSPGYVSARVPQRPPTVLIGKVWRCDRSWRVRL
jgi:hypothetical protein